jgi:hypothetical protein
MKIFAPTETKSAPVKTGGKSKSKKGPAAPVKQEVSASEIREKLASHVETSNTAKSKIVQKNNSKPLGSGFMNEDAKPIVTSPETEGAEPTEKISSLKKSHLLLSDVKLNDPNDSNTQEKLKSVLKMGAFNFNPKEKDALEKILAGT